MALSIGPGISIGGGINFRQEGGAPSAPSTVEYLVVAGGGDGGPAGGGTGGSGVANTGGGGGGAGEEQDGSRNGGPGGDGVVIIRYADTYANAPSTTGSPTITVAGGYKIYKWITSGSITF